MAGHLQPLAVRLESGAELPAAIERAAAEAGLEFCDVNGFGALEWVEIQAAGDDAPTRFDGPLDLLHLSGRLRRAGHLTLAEYTCSVSRTTDAGVELLGGKLGGAVAEFVEIALVPLMAVGAAAGTSRAESVRASPPIDATAQPEDPSAEPKASLAGRWAEALAESRRQERGARERGWDWDSDEVEVRPSRGDIVLHRQFGRCQVVRMDDEHISLRKPDGRVVQLGLAILEFTAAGEDQGKSIYDVAVKRS